MSTDQLVRIPPGVETANLSCSVVRDGVITENIDPSTVPEGLFTPQMRLCFLQPWYVSCAC